MIGGRAAVEPPCTLDMLRVADRYGYSWLWKHCLVYLPKGEEDM